MRIIEEKKAIRMKKQIVEVAKRLYSKNLTFGTSGNISIRDKNCIYITASGTAMADLTESDVSVIDFEGKLIEGKKPSSEKNMHIEIYKKRLDFSAIIHVHAPKTSVFAVCENRLNSPMLSEAIFSLGKISVADYAMPSSGELAEKTADKFLGSDIVIMKNHGVAVGAKDILWAFYKTETLEAYAETMIYSLLVGNIQTLSNQEAEEIIKLRQEFLKVGF